MEEIIKNLGDGVTSAIAVIAVIAVMGGAMYLALQNGVTAFVSGLF